MQIKQLAYLRGIYLTCRYPATIHIQKLDQLITAEAAYVYEAETILPGYPR